MTKVEMDSNAYRQLPGRLGVISAPGQPQLFPDASAGKFNRHLTRPFARDCASRFPVSLLRLSAWSCFVSIVNLANGLVLGWEVVSRRLSYVFFPFPAVFVFLLLSFAAGLCHSVALLL